MIRPPNGLSLPCNFVRVRDGDTVEVSFPGSTRVWALRLIDCWCPETNRGSEASRAKGREAKEFAKRCCEANAEHLSVYIPAPTDPLNLLSALTFDRIPAWLFLTNENTLNENLVAHGLATRDKPKKTKGQA